MNQVVTSPIGNNLVLISLYLVAASCLAFYWVWNSKVSYKVELLVLVFFLLTGNYNDLLIFKVPGVGFEIQPPRFIFLVLLFSVWRRFRSTKTSQLEAHHRATPWFIVVLWSFVGWVTLSLLSHLDILGIQELVAQVSYLLTFIVIVFAIRFIADQEFIMIIGRAVIVAAVVSSVISLVQLGIDHHFMQMGDYRKAFGSVIRSNGIFTAEYTNAYFMIVAIFWALVTWKNRVLSICITLLLVAGILCTFHRMSWLVLTTCMITYLLTIERPQLNRAIALGLLGITVVLSVLAFSLHGIMNSALVQDRLNDSIRGRKGYWSMVIDNIGQKAVFGYGGRDNEVYYSNMLRITQDANRATGESGDIHNGYLQAMFFFGIPAAILFALFSLLTLFYFARLLPYHIFFAIPFFFALLYCMANVTNNFLFNKPLAIICAIHIGIGWGARHLDDFFGVVMQK